MMIESALQNLVEELALPESFLHTVEQFYCPVAESIAHRYESEDGCLFVGVQGCQGSGKSTLAAFLKVLLEEQYSLNTAVLSIDDFYLTKAERISLASKVHPLLVTRGVPGTHDMSLAKETIDKLKHIDADQSALIPRFNKAIDDRHPELEWSKMIGPVQVIILEGWCVGLTEEKPQALETPINKLEEEQDQEGAWRRYVNSKLANEYKLLFDGFDMLVVLNAPSFDAVYQWRLLQEQKLIAKMRASKQKLDHLQTMSPEEIRHFISHYQRLTEHGLKTLHKSADWVLQLQDDHSITEISHKPSTEAMH